MSRVFYYWKTIIWSVIMLIIFLFPADNLSKAPSIPALSEMVHIFMFAVFTWFFVRDRFVASSLNRPLRQNYISAIIFSLLFGVTIELLQYLSGLGRTAEFFDIVFDLAGSLLSTGLIILFFSIRRS